MALKIVKINSSDINEVNKFMLENYFTREQMCLKIGINPERDVSDWLCEVTQPILEQNVKAKKAHVKFPKKFTIFTEELTSSFRKRK